MGTRLTKLAAAAILVGATMDTAGQSGVAPSGPVPGPSSAICRGLQGTGRVDPRRDDRGIPLPGGSAILTKPTTYTEIIEVLRRADQHEFIQLDEVGKTSQGRSLFVECI